ncbi:methyltransferase [Nonomuraea sp. WAC 01424]|uniref:methyltransferase n=1 Tax=Nonomuraea sp. WAC 01424 TaxID=2203200 RepID=UPI00163BCEC5|nr:methyltransferase [Nonomuraea sp. WAC 01424]
MSALAELGVADVMSETPSEVAQLFDRGLLDRSSQVTAPVVAAFDHRDCDTAVDVGGGLGHVLDAVLAALTHGPAGLVEAGPIPAPSG